MSTGTAGTEIRLALTRERIIEAAVDFIDIHGLDALSMRKLGTALDVKGMSLYNHIANKSELLDGVVESLWAETEAAAPALPDWREGIRSLAHAVRATVRRHPNAAPLIFSQQLMPQAALRLVRTHVAELVAAGFDRSTAYDLLRTIWSYAFGSAFAEITWDPGNPGCAVDARQLLRPGTPDELAAVADVFCGQSNAEAQFELGLDLMLRGIEQPS
ncbi:TetR/AcrR family transcriptional regulator [Nocardioides sp. NPDC057772]|uniref:TetR/AcrR family transcriptional regulator n=1 Tax=Nocardioides sp. NPDC057772 TaxID=3346245 RepID=UPI0002028A0A|nr:putative transcriptional regulator [Nocardioidaceae bacterium Broad-1]